MSGVGESLVISGSKKMETVLSRQSGRHLLARYSDSRLTDAGKRVIMVRM